MNAQDVLDNLLLQAISQVMTETETNPLTVGTRVGQLDLDTYGVEPAMLVEVTVDGYIVQREGQEKTLWPVKGTVNVDRVNVVYAEMMDKVSARLRIVKMLGDLLGGGAGSEDIGPTPGCDCPVCTEKIAAQTTNLPIQ